MNIQHESPTPSKFVSVQNLLANPAAVCLIAGLLLIVAYLIDGGLGCLALPVFIVFSIGYYRSKSEENPGMILAVPFLLNVAAIFIVLFVPLMEIRLGIIYKINKPEYEQIVKLVHEDIKAGKIVLGERSSCTLFTPLRESHLISVDSILICNSRHGSGYFIEFREAGTISYDAGHIYVNSSCKESDCVPYYEIFRLVELNWYFYKENTLQ